MPEAIEAEEIHFSQGLFGRPFFDGDAIGGGENAGAIIAEAAVHEDFLPRLVVKKREELNNLLVGGWRPAADGDVDKTHAKGFGALAFPSDFFAVFTTQVNDGSDAQQFQFGKAHFFGLRAAVESFRNLSSVGNAGDAEFLSKSGLNKRWSGRLRRGWRRRLRK